MSRYAETVWQFETARFRIALEIRREETPPEDYFEFPDDIEAVRSGSVAWFSASVVVYLDGREIARDSLGCCAYATVAEFYRSHWDSPALDRNSSIMRAARGQNSVICHYFPSMVTEATSAARKALGSLPELRH